MFYISTKYDENLRTLLICCAFRHALGHALRHAFGHVLGLNSALWASYVDLPSTSKGHCSDLMSSWLVRINWYFSHKKASQVLMELKSELLDQKSLMSPTFCNFEIFYHDPQLDMKV